MFRAERKCPKKKKQGIQRYVYSFVLLSAQENGKRPKNTERSKELEERGEILGTSLPGLKTYVGKGQEVKQ